MRDDFVQLMGDTFARGGIVPHVQIHPAGYLISLRGYNSNGGILYFVIPALDQRNSAVGIFLNKFIYHGVKVYLLRSVLVNGQDS